jgi:mono/diheme cytochrome c family protein
MTPDCILFRTRVVRSTSICLVSLGIWIIGILLATAQNKDTATDKNKQSTYAALAEAPPKARERKNPFAGDPEAVAAGGNLFEQHCSECHGKQAVGAKKGPSLLREEVQQSTPGTLFWILSNGVVRKGMPVWSKLPEQQRWQLVAYLQSLSAQSTKPPPH